MLPSHSPEEGSCQFFLLCSFLGPVGIDPNPRGHYHQEHVPLLLVINMQLHATAFWPLSTSYHMQIVVNCECDCSLIGSFDTCFSKQLLLLTCKMVAITFVFSLSPPLNTGITSSPQAGSLGQFPKG